MGSCRAWLCAAGVSAVGGDQGAGAVGPGGAPATVLGGCGLVLAGTAWSEAQRGLSLPRRDS